jgi:hypothetical protein
MDPKGKGIVVNYKE